MSRQLECTQACSDELRSTAQPRHTRSQLQHLPPLVPACPPLPRSPAAHRRRPQNPTPSCSIVYDTTAALGGALGLKAIRLSEQFVEAYREGEHSTAQPQPRHSPAGELGEQPACCWQASGRLACGAQAQPRLLLLCNLSRSSGQHSQLALGDPMPPCSTPCP